MKWTVPGTIKDGKNQRMYSICNCKYTKSPPFCDATHINLPLEYLKAQRNCIKDHKSVILCTTCGFKPT